jgi:hypothetical protein
MGTLPGVALLLVATALAMSAAGEMTGARRPMPSSRRPGGEERRAVIGLVLACVAVGVATVGAALLSSGERSIGGLCPFGLAVIAVLTPLARAAISVRNRGTGRRAGRSS